MLKQKAQNTFQQAMVLLFGNVLDWSKLKDVAKNNYELGVSHFKRGNHKDAIFRLKIATRLDPGNPIAWYYLGRAYFVMGQKAEAKAALARSLKLKPSQEAAYVLALVGGRKTPEAELPKAIPLSLSVEFFDQTAAGFTAEQIETYGYRGHLLLANALRACLAPGRIDHEVLELGVGTGLCGSLLKDVSARMTGVDISENMLAEVMKQQDTAGRKIYDALVRRDLKEFLQEAAPAAYDVVLAAGVLSFIGELGAVFPQVARVLKKDGLFAFTADEADGQGFRFDAETGRFVYSKSYLQGLASASGMTELKVEEVTPYPGQKAWLCVFRK